ncbi:MAG: biopolymer transporter ExbD [Henriciella sp.]|nr:biopolymer transporter ExbD [Henriciella sp.]
MARRKRASASGEGADDDVNLTPMLDVVFILLIFFIVTAQFIREPGVDVDRQEVENLDAQNPLGILIAVDDQSKIWMNKQEVSLQEVGFNIRELREANPKGKLVIQVDQDAEAGVMIDLVEIVNKEDGLNLVPISVLEE